MTDHSRGEVLRALYASVDKWRAIVAGTKNDEGVRNCALCALFWTENVGTDALITGTCFGCPVREKTGMHGCVGSPYTAFSIATRGSGGWARTWEHVKLAIEELKFLLEVLDEFAKAPRPEAPALLPWPPAPGDAPDALYAKLVPTRDKRGVILALVNRAGTETSRGSLARVSAAGIKLPDFVNPAFGLRLDSEGRLLLLKN